MGAAYPGQHSAIVDQDLWDRVQATLAENRVERASGVRAKQPSLLTGLLFDQTGERLTPTHAVKKGTRYRYYVSASLMTGTRKANAAGWRIPAGNLEGLVIDRLRTLLRDPGELLDTIGEHVSSGIGTRQLIERAGRIGEELTDRSPGEIRALVINLVRRVEIGAESIEIAVDRQRLITMLQGQVVQPPDRAETHGTDPEGAVKLKIAARLQRAGRQMRMVVQSSSVERPADPALFRVLARSHAVQNRLTQNPDLSVHDIARSENVTAAYLYSILRLPWLAPDITDAIVNGCQPPRLTARKLIRLSTHLPISWAEQRRLLGFPQDETAGG